MSVRILQGACRDVLPTLPAESIDCCVTSPPYWGLRDYGVACQIGLEATPEEFVETLVGVFREVRRVLKPTGTLWLNMGDAYANDGKWGGSTGGKHVSALHGSSGIGRAKRKTALKPKDLIGQPWMLAFALRADGWYLRADIIWHKPNPMPESVRDRPTKAHEYVFLMSKSDRYFYDADAIAEPFADARMGNPGPYRKTSSADRKAVRERQDLGFLNNGGGWNSDGVKQARNARSVWTISTQAYPDAHFATFPEELPKRCILAGCPEGGTVLDPFAGSGTVGQVAQSLGHDAVLIEANPDYIAMIERRCAQRSLLEVSA